MDDSRSAAQATSQPAFEWRQLDEKNIRPRKANFVFEHTIPKHWLSGSPTGTHFFNAFTLFAVVIENYMVRVLRDALPLVSDQEIARQVRGLMGQEATHARAHEKFLFNLRQQGYSIDRFLRIANVVFEEFLEKLGTKVNVSAIAGFEHLRALVAEIVFSKEMLNGAEPTMGELFAWHAAEELEHKAVAFDLLQAMSSSYVLRATGAMLGVSIVLGLLGGCTVMLLWQDGELLRKRTWREAADLLFGRYQIGTRGFRMFAEYFRPRFHPSWRPTSHFAAPILSPVAQR